MRRCKCKCSSQCHNISSRCHRKGSMSVMVGATAAAERSSNSIVAV
jgi:hypothetical protein